MKGLGKSRKPDINDLSRALAELRQAGQTPNRALFDRVKACGLAAVQPLIEIAVACDDSDTDSENPEIWAPVHAIQLLGEIGAAEAVDPLVPLLDRSDDDYLAEALVEAFVGIGATAVPPLCALLLGRNRDLWARVRAAESLGKIGRRYPQTRAGIVSALIERLDPSQTQAPDDEILNGFAIAALLEMKATEAAPAIRQAFAEDRVDTLVVGLSESLADLGLAPERGATPRAKGKGMQLRLRCTACRHVRPHEIETIYCDLPTQERRAKGEETPYSQFVIPQRITCPKCGVVDQYELAEMAYIALMAEVLKKLAAQRAGATAGSLDEGPLQFIRFGLLDGREMHPYEARDLYRQRVGDEPENAELRVRYANVLRGLGHQDEAIAQYRAALRLEPANLEALLNLGRLDWQAGDLAEARGKLKRVLTQAPLSQLSHRDRERYLDAAQRDLDELDGPFEHLGGEGPILLYAGDLEAPMLALPQAQASTVRRVGAKTGRNDPCPCGSGKKFKRCHGG